VLRIAGGWTTMNIATRRQQPHPREHRMPACRSSAVPHPNRSDGWAGDPAQQRH
jgi:hypothetical protein